MVFSTEILDRVVKDKISEYQSEATDRLAAEREQAAKKADAKNAAIQKQQKIEQHLDSLREPILSSEVYKGLKDSVLLFAKNYLADSDLQFFERNASGPYSRHHSLIGSEVLYELGLHTKPQKDLTDYTKMLKHGRVVDPSKNYWHDRHDDDRYVTVPENTISFSFLANGEFELLSREIEFASTSYSGGLGALQSIAYSIHQDRYLPAAESGVVMRLLHTLKTPVLFNPETIVETSIATMIRELGIISLIDQNKLQGGLAVTLTHQPK